MGATAYTLSCKQNDSCVLNFLETNDQDIDMSAKGPDDPAFAFGSTVNMRWYPFRRESGKTPERPPLSRDRQDQSSPTRRTPPLEASAGLPSCGKDTPYGTLSATCSEVPKRRNGTGPRRRSPIRSGSVSGVCGSGIGSPPMSSAPPGRTDAALRSVHTTNLPALFAQLQLSLVVSTYQAGKVILVRPDGGVLNTHFRTFAKPMGIAADRARLTIGGTKTVWEYRNVPAVARNLEPPGKHDACYLPRRLHVTGDIDIHEMAYDSRQTSSGWSTRASAACVRWMPTTASSPLAAAVLSVPWPRRTAVI